MFDCDYAFYWIDEDDHIFCADKVREEKEKEANEAKEKAQENSSLMDDYVTEICDDLTKPKIVEVSYEKEKANNDGAVSD